MGGGDQIDCGTLVGLRECREEGFCDVLLRMYCDVCEGFCGVWVGFGRGGCGSSDVLLRN